MKTRQILQDSVSVLIVAFSIFVLFFSGGVAGYVFKHNPFLFVSLLSATAICICRLFRVDYKPKKAEKIVAVVYLCLALLLVFFNLEFTAFECFTFSVDSDPWDIRRITISVFFMDFCALWLAVLSARLLVRIRQQTVIAEESNKESL